jgi:AhpD family alkylhydroperoxidase
MNREQVECWQQDRQRLNEQVMKNAGIVTKRFHNLDWKTYQDGALPAKTKELLGLVASLVLRCDDCILYHLMQLRELGITAEELEESLSVCLIVGGSITIPHIRRVWDTWEALEGSSAVPTETE